MAKITIKAKFGVVPNTLINNPNISLKAKGLYALIQSKHDNWDFSGDRIAKETSDGRASVYSGLSELEKFRYLERKKYKNQKGQWETEYYLYENPQQSIDENQHWKETKTTADFPQSDFPQSENRQTNKERDTKKEIIKKNIVSKDTTEIEIFDKDSSLINSEIVEKEKLGDLEKTNGEGSKSLQTAGGQEIVKEDKRIFEIDLIVNTLKELNGGIIDDTVAKQRQYGKLIKDKIAQVHGFNGDYVGFISVLNQKSPPLQKQYFRSLEKFYFNLAGIIAGIRASIEHKKEKETVATIDLDIF